MTTIHGVPVAESAGRVALKRRRRLKRVVILVGLLITLIVVLVAIT